jgi:predicted HD superfamily hydrolase involved in NAD metabolism
VKNVDAHPYLAFLERVLTPARLAHSLGTMQVMGELAEVYGLDQEMARTIGILHDAGKDLPPDQQEELIIEGNPRTDLPFASNYEYMHGLAGSALIQRELGIRDPLILDAITSHTFIGPSPYFHHPLSWCLRFSDIIEPYRDWRAEKRILALDLSLKELVYDGKMVQAARVYTETMIQWFLEKGRPLHPNFYQVKGEFAVQMPDGLLSIQKITTLINQTVDSFPHSECQTCECFLGYVTQLQFTADPIGKAYLETFKPNRTKIHSCLGCDPCPPGDQYAVTIRGNTP